MSSDPIGPQLLLQALLILINAFFAATEIAIISLNDNKLKRQAESGDKRAQLMLRIAQEPTTFLSTIQIGITLAGFLGSAFAADNLAGRLTYALVHEAGFTAIPESTVNTLSVIVITLVLSFLTLVFGELVPKRAAMQKPEKFSRAVIGVINVISKIVTPLNWLLTKSTNGVLKLLRVDLTANSDDVSEEEILYMVDVGEEKGAIEKSEKEMIANIFEFSDMTAEDIMIHRTDVQFIWAEDTDKEILDVIKKSGFSRFPVCGEDQDDILGILLARDFLINMQSERPLSANKLLKPAYSVPESVDADVLFRNMQSSKTHIAIVVDEYGGTAGIVTLEDLLEEIVGNIYDESDALDEREIVPLGDGTWRIAGSAQLDEVSDELDIILPEDEEFDTLGGLIVDALSSIPDDGTQPEVTAYGLGIKVESVLDRRIEWAIVKKLEPSGQDASAAQDAEE